MSCAEENTNNVSQETLISNEELHQMYNEDQSDRQSGNINWQVVSKNDNTREARALELLDLKKVNTAQYYSNAAMIFQHGGDTIASGMAVKMIRKAIEVYHIVVNPGRESTLSRITHQPIKNQSP